MSLSEILLILIVGIFVLKPSDWKVVIKTIKHISSYIGKLKQEIFSSFDDEELSSKKDQEQINNYLAKIISMSGKYEGEYDLASIKAYYHKLLLSSHKDKV